ncbi:4-alpha-glucanotransferase [Lachnospiraceae bacterium PF1-21]|uniref:4-alpha-glucanotransferase n=1 Tax=Ohessyouella blattaphilus TaxID=2949333 RepID=UPI003E2578B5
MRGSGILLPISCLPSAYGIGCFSKEAYEFADQLKEAGQKYWQILPLGPTGYGDSPYQSFSTFAGNPYFIDLEVLIKEGVLDKAYVDSLDYGQDEEAIDYEKIYHARWQVLGKAYEHSNVKSNAEFMDFCEKEKIWLDDYALYTAVKKSFDDRSWLTWDDDIRLRKEKALEEYRSRLKTEIEFYKYVQYLFFKQWTKLKKYVNDLGIKIIGDIPIYVAMDSADAWANPELFEFDSDVRPTKQSGVPPDGFSPTGQLWGNPIYRWEKHASTGFAWWCKRMEYQRRLYDVIRIDHFRGFDQYYAVPIEDTTAENGQWEDGPGMALFKALEETLGDIEIIAEDLGFLTDSVRMLLKETGYPGMKVLQFAFDPREKSNYLPHTYPRNCVVYTGTHDNTTTRGWYQEIKPDERKFATHYLGRHFLSDRHAAREFIRLAMSSTANLCVIPLQDYLNLDARARINQPGIVGGNWIWRYKRSMIKKKMLRRVRDLVILYDR